MTSSFGTKVSSTYTKAKGEGPKYNVTFWHEGFQYTKAKGEGPKYNNNIFWHKVSNTLRPRVKALNTMTTYFLVQRFQHTKAKGKGPTCNIIFWRKGFNTPRPRAKAPNTISSFAQGLRAMAGT